MEQKLIDCFPNTDQQIISIIGSGGKTSLMRYLAANCSEKKVLITTSTKIGLPKVGTEALVMDDFSRLGHFDARIEIAGVPVKDQPKLKMPPEVELVNSFSQFEAVFIEADGSKQRPLKAWADFEPVVLPQTTMTVGILPLSVLGQRINTQTIHRLERFLSVFPLKNGQLITPAVLAEISAHSQGLFAKAVGTKVLFFSQSDQVEESVVQTLLSALPLSFLERLDRVIFGSVLQGRGQILWKQ